MKNYDGFSTFFEARKSLISRFSMFICVILSIMFFITMYRHSIDAPFAFDDARMYLSSFLDGYVEAENFAEKIKYFFSATNFPHTQSIGRIISAVHYELFGHVSLKFLILVGSLVLISFVFTAKYVSRLDFFYVLPVVLILLLPDRVNFWIGPISGYTFLLLCSLLIFYGLSKGKFIGPAALAFVASFAQSPGLAIFIAALPLFLIEPNKATWKRLMWLGVFGLSIFVYWTLVLSTSDLVRADEGRSIATLAKCIPSMIVYEGQYLALPFFGLLEVSKAIQSTPIVGACLTIALVLILAGTAFYRRKSFDPRAAVFLSFLLFGLSAGPMAAFVNDNCNSFSDSVAPRYMMYSVMSWSAIYLYLVTSASRYLRIVIAVVFMGMFLPRYLENYRQSEYFHNFRIYTWMQGPAFDPAKGKGQHSFYQKFAAAGIYSPYIPEFLNSGGAVPTNPEKLQDIFYSLDMNESFCKLEMIIDHENNDVVEIWIDENEKTTRLIPAKTYRNMANRNFYDFAVKMVQTEKTHSYLYMKPNDGCSNLRIRIGNGVTDYLIIDPEKD